MIRSGSTVQYNVARLLVQELGVGWARAEFERRYPEEAPPAGELAADGRLYVHKTHDLRKFKYAEQEDIFRIAERGGIRLLYVHRDVRDVVVSLREKLDVTFEHAVKMIDWALDSYDVLRPHVGQPWVLVQQYDGLIADIPVGAEAIATLLGLEPGQHLIESIAQECSLEAAERVSKHLRRELVANSIHGLKTKSGELPREKLRRMAHMFNLDKMVDVGFIDNETRLHFNHVSKFRGRSGVWRAELTKEQIDRLHNRFGTWLQEMGYELS